MRDCGEIREFRPVQRALKFPRPGALPRCAAASCTRLTRPCCASQTQWLPSPPSRAFSWPSVRPRARRAASSSACRPTPPGRRRYEALSGAVPAAGACEPLSGARTLHRAVRLGLDRSNGRCAHAGSPPPLISGPRGARALCARSRRRGCGCPAARVPPNGCKARDKLKVLRPRVSLQGTPAQGAQRFVGYKGAWPRPARLPRRHRRGARGRWLAPRCAAGAPEALLSLTPPPTPRRLHHRRQRADHPLRQAGPGVQAGHEERQGQH